MIAGRGLHWGTWSNRGPFMTKMAGAVSRIMMGILLFRLLHVHGQHCDCNNITTIWAPVCDNDGVQYQSICVAFCQGVEATAPCSRADAGRAVSGSRFSPPLALNKNAIAQQAKLTLADVNQFASSGFRFVARYKLQTGTVVMPRLARSSGVPGSESDMRVGDTLAVRVDHLGNVYVQLADNSAQYSTRSSNGTADSSAADSALAHGNWDGNGNSLDGGDAAGDDTGDSSDDGFPLAEYPDAGGGSVGDGSQLDLLTMLEVFAGYMLCSNDRRVDADSVTQASWETGEIGEIRSGQEVVLQDATMSLLPSSSNISSIQDIDDMLYYMDVLTPVMGVLLEHNPTDDVISAYDVGIAGQAYHGGQLTLNISNALLVGDWPAQGGNVSSALAAVTEAMSGCGAALLVFVPLDIDADLQNNFDGSEGPRAGGSNNVITAAGRKLVTPPDNRVEVNSAKMPYSAVGHLSPGCSASLIGSNLVLTAGHCVYNALTRTFYANQYFYPNRRGGAPVCIRFINGVCVQRAVEDRYAVQYVTTVWTRAPAPTLCSDGRSYCYSMSAFVNDYALIKLRTPVKPRYGKLSVGYKCSPHSYTVVSAGYPGDLTQRLLNRMFMTQGKLNSFSGCDTTMKNALVGSTLDIAPGQSGSPVWSSSTAGGTKQYTVRALVNYVSGDGSGVPGHRTITKTVYDNLQAWSK